MKRHRRNRVFKPARNMDDKLTTGFNYSDLDADTAGKLRQLAGEAGAAVRRSAKDLAALASAVYRAHLLLARHKSGAFGRFVESELPISREYANQLRLGIEAVRGDEEKYCQLLTTTAVKTASLLGKPDTPAAAVDEVLKRSADVPRIEAEFVKDVIQKHAPPVQDDRDGRLGKDGTTPGAVSAMVKCPTCKGQGEITRDRAERARFVPPSLEQVRAYIEERGSSVDPEAFIAHYEMVGWKYGKGPGKPIKSWQAAVLTWEKNNGKAPSGSAAQRRLKRRQGE